MEGGLGVEGLGWEAWQGLRWKVVRVSWCCVLGRRRTLVCVGFLFLALYPMVRPPSSLVGLGQWVPSCPRHWHPRQRQDLERCFGRRRWRCPRALRGVKRWILRHKNQNPHQINKSRHKSHRKPHVETTKPLRGRDASAITQLNAR